MLAVLLFVCLLGALSKPRLRPHKPTEEENNLGEARIICISIYDYKMQYGMFPDVNGPLAKTLSGDNPQHIEFLQVGEDRIDDNGKYLDPTGKPFHIVITEKSIQVFYAEGGLVATCDIKTGQTHTFSKEDF